MVTEQMSAEQALKSLQREAPWVHPNPGFMHQLALYHDMGLKADPSYGPYQAMMLNQRRQLATLNTRPLPRHCQVSCIPDKHPQKLHVGVFIDILACITMFLKSVWHRGEISVPSWKLVHLSSMTQLALDQLSRDMTQSAVQALATTS